MPTRGSPNMGKPMKKVALSEIKDDLSRFLRLAEGEEIVITRRWPAVRSCGGHSRPIRWNIATMSCAPA
jgi:hypothetical protein